MSRDRIFSGMFNSLKMKAIKAYIDNYATLGAIAAGCPQREMG
jgi:hypothetical protein